MRGLLSHCIPNILLQLFCIKENVMNPEKIFQRLRSKGMRITPLKRQLIELFINGACGLSAKDVQGRLSCNPHISTIHRCLCSLKKAGFLRPDRNTTGILRYRCSRSFYPDHGHFKCEKCGRRFPVSFNLPDEFIRMLETTCSFKVVNSDIFLEGRCSQCVQ